MLVLAGFFTQAQEPLCYFGNLRIQHFRVLAEQLFQHTTVSYLCSLQLAMDHLHIDQ